MAMVAVPFLMGLLAAPAVAPSPVRGDPLADAMAQQRALEDRIAAEKKLIASITVSQASVQQQIAQTATQLDGIISDLAATREQIANLSAEVDRVQATYTTLVAQLADLDLQLQQVEAQEAQKRVELGQLKARLADRIRAAYDASGTSLLETFLSGASFTDMLAAMSSQLDAAEQDRVLARQIADDRATLLSIHQTVQQSVADTTIIRQQTEVQKQQLDLRLADLQAARDKLTALQAASEAALAAQQASYDKLAADKAAMAKSIAAADAARKALQAKIDQLVAAMFAGGNIPSQFHGTLVWPMAGYISQPFGCTGFSWEPPYGSCAHFHQGIDIVAPYGTPVVAAATGRVVYIGWNYADGVNPAWIVIIAHSSVLTTWYAHMQPTYPVHAGDVVRQGQVIGYEGSTGHSTGAHLHWAVQLDGVFRNPAAFT